MADKLDIGHFTLLFWPIKGFSAAPQWPINPHSPTSCERPARGCT
jgi:hypothetical protein